MIKLLFLAAGSLLGVALIKQALERPTKPTKAPEAENIDPQEAQPAENPPTWPM